MFRPFVTGFDCLGRDHVGGKSASPTVQLLLRLMAFVIHISGVQVLYHCTRILMLFCAFHGFLLILLAPHVLESNLGFTLTRISMHVTLLSVSADHENRESTEFLKLNKSTEGQKPSLQFAFISCALLKERIKLELGKKILYADCTDVLFFQIQL